MTKPLLETLLTKKHSSRTPVWIMRQAGRYLPEYREIRKKHDNFISFCLSPKDASEVTIQPLRRFDLDAAIIFSDILILPFLLGQKVDFLKNRGPVLDSITNGIELKKLTTFDEKKAENIYETVFRTKTEINKNFKNTTLIGFAGAPWTVATYMVEGGSSKDFFKIKNFMYNQTKDFAELIEIITQNTITYLQGQIEAGAEVIKIFDSWAGILPEEEFKKWVIEPTKKIVFALKQKHPNIPVICFPKGAGTKYQDFVTQIEPTSIAVDQTMSLTWLRKNLKKEVVLQGNMDNVLLLAENKEKIKEEVRRKKQEMAGLPYIFNLGHGILPNTPIENVEAIFEAIRNE